MNKSANDKGLFYNLRPQGLNINFPSYFTLVCKLVLELFLHFIVD